MVSMGAVRSLSLLLIALLGVLGLVAVPSIEGEVSRFYEGEVQVRELQPDPAGELDFEGNPLPEGYTGDRYAYVYATYTGRAASLLLPELDETALVSEHWGFFYGVVREVMLLVAIIGVLVTALMQYRDRTAGGCLVLTPIAVLAYLALPVLLPEGQEELGALLVFACLLAIGLGVWADLQPEDYGRPAYYSALGVTLAMVIYMGDLGRAVSVPVRVIGDDASMDQIRWGLELLAILVAPAALVALPTLKLAWNRSQRGLWWG